MVVMFSLVRRAQQGIYSVLFLFGLQSTLCFRRRFVTFYFLLFLFKGRDDNSPYQVLQFCGNIVQMPCCLCCNRRCRLQQCTERSGSRAPHQALMFEGVQEWWLPLAQLPLLPRVKKLLVRPMVTAAHVDTSRVALNYLLWNYSILNLIIDCLCLPIYLSPLYLLPCFCGYAAYQRLL